MNQRQRAFCEAYLVSGNATEAAKEAGYSTQTAYSSGQRLLKNVEVQEYLNQRNREISTANTAQAGEIRQFWTELMRDTAAKPGERLKGSELLAKALGMFTDQEEPEKVDIEAIRAEERQKVMSFLTEDQLRMVLKIVDVGDDGTVIYIPDNGRDSINERE